MARAMNSRKSSLSSITRTFLLGLPAFAGSCMGAPFPEEGRPGCARLQRCPISPRGGSVERMPLFGWCGALLDGLDLDHFSGLGVEGSADLVARLELVDSDRLAVAGDGRLGRDVGLEHHRVTAGIDLLHPDRDLAQLRLGGAGGLGSRRRGRAGRT